MGSVIRKILVALIAAAVVLGINAVQVPKYDHSNSDWPATITVKGFYDMEPYTVDVIFLGSSVAVNAFSPHYLYNEFGIRSYNLSTAHQSVFMSYWMLREALRFQTPRAVVLDCRFCFRLNPEEPLNMSEGVVRQAIDPMQWSAVKREAIRDICAHDPSQDILSFYLTNLRYHERWKSLEETDFRFDLHDPLLGWSAASGPSEPIQVFVPSDPQARAEMDPLMKEYLDRIVALCEENSIRLVLVDVPGNNVNDGIFNTMAAYAAEHNLSYYNFASQEVVNTFGQIMPYERLTTHANYFGMKKLTRFIGSILQFSLAVLGTEDAQYEEQTMYHAVEDNAGVNRAEQIDELLSVLQKDHYIIFAAVNEDGWADTADSNAWKTLGFHEDPFTASRYSYAAVSGMQEQLSEEKAVLQGSFGTHQYHVESCGDASGRKASVVIDGTEYAVNQKGLNLVVFDTETGRVIESCVLTDEGLVRP
ncbi:MAG: hypothetical protein IKF51_08565 [Solobacterium sp.]|nr:hypothetical protein [Solobacterium sp.]